MSSFISTLGFYRFNIKSYNRLIYYENRAHDVKKQKSDFKVFSSHVKCIGKCHWDVVKGTDPTEIQGDSKKLTAILQGFVVLFKNTY